MKLLSKRKNILLGVATIILSLLLVSCSDASKEDLKAGFRSPGDDKAAKVSNENPTANTIPQPVEQKLIKNGEVNFKVKNIVETKTQISKAVTSNGGYVSKENSSGDRENPWEQLVVRIPSKNFDKFLNEALLGVDDFDNKDITIDDVTDQFVDIEARLKNKKQLEVKYQELLQKATRMEDILKIEHEISLIREDIESTEGRLKYLENKVSYSTVILTYYEKTLTGFNFGGKAGDAISNGGKGFLWFLIIVINLWPLWLLGGLAWFIIARIVKRTKAKKATQKAA